ncbi:MAG: transposase [Synechococcus sp. SB0678_bin_12]|nr:transposase [Synechococcus sp. SB0678_bin_12]MYI88100.1 transposase [Synechococcus sp. SB0672_bin_10]
MGGLSLSKHTGGVLKGAGYESRIQEKGSGRHPLDVAAKERNGERSKTRSRVEHVCAQMEVVMGGKLTGCIGLAREKAWWCLGNLVFNFFRLMQHQYGLVSSPLI